MPLVIKDRQRTTDNDKVEEEEKRLPQRVSNLSKGKKAGAGISGEKVQTEKQGGLETNVTTH